LQLILGLCEKRISGRAHDLDTEAHENTESAKNAKEHEEKIEGKQSENERSNLHCYMSDELLFGVIGKRKGF
jgi:hypothetical protein